MRSSCSIGFLFLLRFATPSLPSIMQTFLTRLLAHHFRSVLNRNILLSATTGAAATRLSRSAATVHNSFVIPTKGFVSPLGRSHASRDILKQSTVYFIDEMSMLTTEVLCNVLNRLMQIHECPSLPKLKEKVLIILVGDHGQASSELLGGQLGGGDTM